MAIEDRFVKNQISPNALAAIVDYSDDAILYKDLDGIILSWNRGAERMYGYSAEEVIGKPVNVLVPDDMPNEIPAIMAKLRRGERIRHFETRRRRKNGTIMDISLSISPVFDDAGNVVGASAIGRDITQEKKFREFRNFLASIVDSSDDAIFSKDLDGLILTWNKGAKELYGYEEEEIVGRHVSILTPPEKPDEIAGIMARLKRGEKINHYETTRLRKDGSRIIVSLTISPIRGGDDRIIGASVIARDVTARKLIEEERSRLIQELENTVAQKDVLLQEVYHRVKNNLQIVSSLLELRSRYVSADPLQGMAAFQESINRIRAMALVHEKLYRTENLHKLDFPSYLRSLTAQLMRSYNFENQTEIVISGDPCSFELDQAIPLGLIFTELVTNSFKYAFNNPHKGKIEIHFAVKGNNVDVTFHDNGKGLPDGISFEKSDSFGFRIIRLLANQMKAKITHAGRSKGTKFRLQIPIFVKSEERDAFLRTG